MQSINRNRAILAGALALALSTSCAAQALSMSPSVLTNKDVIILAGAGFSEGFILDTIAGSHAQFDITANGLADLAKHAISERIVRAMMEQAALPSQTAAGTVTVQADAPMQVVMPSPEGNNPKARPRLVKPSTVSTAISSGTPYYEWKSVLWGLWKKKSRCGSVAGRLPGGDAALGQPVPAGASAAASARRASGSTHDLSVRSHGLLRGGAAMNRFAWLLALAAGPLLRAQAVQFRTTELPWAIAGAGYSAAIETAADGNCLTGNGIALSLAQGELPRGLALRGENLTGVPAAIGTYRFAIRAASRCGAAVREFELVVTGRPILRVVPEELVFEYRAGAAAPKQLDVLVASTWPRLPYTVSTGKIPWLEYYQTIGATPDLGSPFSADRIAVRVNPDKLSPGLYHATLTISTWQGANAPVIPVTLKVLP